MRHHHQEAIARERRTVLDGLLAAVTALHERYEAAAGTGTGTGTRVCRATGPWADYRRSRAPLWRGTWAQRPLGAAPLRPRCLRLPSRVPD